MHKTEFQLTSLHDNRPFLADATYLNDKVLKPVIVFNHGFKGYKDWGPFPIMAQKFAEAGFVFFKMNFSHNGTTLEKPTEFADLAAFGNNNFSKELDDTGILLDELFDRRLPVDYANIDLDRVYLFGHSRGGASALLKAAEDPRIKKVVTWAAISDLEAQYSLDDLEQWKKQGTIYIHNSRTQQEMPLRFQLVEDYQKNRARLHVPSAIRCLDIPLLAIHGSEDETVSIKSLHYIKELNREAQTEIVEGANHTFGGTEPYLEKELPEDFEEMVELSVKFLN